jgi:hypothetical protein
MFKNQIADINNLFLLINASSDTDLEALVDLPLGGPLAAYILAYRRRVERRSSRIAHLEALNQHLIRKLREVVGFDETGKILQEGRNLGYDVRPTN